MKGKLVIVLLFFLTLWIPLKAQIPTQTLKGRVLDQDSGLPIVSATIVLLGSEIREGTISDENGYFRIENVSVGRYHLTVSFIGFETMIITEVEVSSAKEVELEIFLTETPIALEEIEIRPTLIKEKPLNGMATSSARMLSMEEAKRYAGGFDDPARLAAVFAGVASGINNNALVVRGNSPHYLQWRMEGVEIPNPNHFADLASFGGGAVTGLSGQLLGNSDILTGAFPAEYNNALSGIFDMNMRHGNTNQKESTIQLGAMGIDLASEGPFKKGHNASYLFNYRYSTFGLVSKITNANEGIDYQDLSFKFHFPTKKAGAFSLWGIGLVDRIIVKEKTDMKDWYYESDKENYDAKQFMGSYGIGHKIFLNNKSQLKTTLAATVNGTDWKVRSLNHESELKLRSEVQNVLWNITLTSALKTKFSKMHTNKTGVTATSMYYDMLLRDKMPQEPEPQIIIDQIGNGLLLSGYSHSIIRKNRFTVSMGINGQYATLNKKATLEPRLAMKFQWKTNQTLGFAYGLHSRMERLNFYLVENPQTGMDENKVLGFSRAHHLVVSYDLKLKDNMLLKMEPYFQYLYNIPVVPHSSISLLNLNNDWFASDTYVNKGKGRNYGLDLTLEKYLDKGYYYLVSASLFNSKYLGGDRVWRNTRFNRGYILNILGGREWQLGKNKQNILGINARINYMGGERYIPYNLEASLATEDVIDDDKNAFSKQIDPALILHFTLNFKINRSKTSHEFALKILNATSYGDFQGFDYNRIENTIDETREIIMIPNISYRIDF